jgi:anthranilate phosphoribosyltransferase
VRLTPMMAEVLRRLGHVHALVFTGPDGVDELGVAGVARCYEVTAEGVRDFLVDPRDVGLEAAPLDAIRGGDAPANAATIRSVLDGERGPRRDVVLLNAAAVLVAADQVTTLLDGVAIAAASIDTGAAQRSLEQLVRVSHEVAA